MWRAELFFLRYVVGAYLLITALFLIIAFVDFVVGVMTSSYKSDRQATTFSTRFSTATMAPVLLFTKKGRRLLSKLWRNIVI